MAALSSDIPTEDASSNLDEIRSLMPEQDLLGDHVYLRFRITCGNPTFPRPSFRTVHVSPNLASPRHYRRAATPSSPRPRPPSSSSSSPPVHQHHASYNRPRHQSRWKAGAQDAVAVRLSCVVCSPMLTLLSRRFCPIHHVRPGAVWQDWLT